MGTVIGSKDDRPRQVVGGRASTLQLSVTGIGPGQSEADRGLSDRVVIT
ncbi:MAG TPA: hypothetical protein VMU94_31840 [Streptosporangiaceae bacterium]|nr:hypothetical protein [Streptosporangiaceae bacterium]